jgi:hypothetical protein
MREVSASSTLPRSVIAASCCLVLPPGRSISIETFSYRRYLLAKRRHVQLDRSKNFQFYEKMIVEACDRERSSDAYTESPCPPYSMEGSCFAPIFF